eukprot:1317788-Amorphochlora_amoeboformis.AAC.1
MDLELDDDENSASDEKFPESADELMARYKNSGYLTIREGVDVPGHLAMVLCMAKLEALSATESPSDDKIAEAGGENDTSIPVMNKPFCVSVSSRTFEHLSNLLAKTSQLYLSPEEAKKACPNGLDDYVAEMYILLSALRILKVHLYQAVRSRMSLTELRIDPTVVDGLRQLVYDLLKHMPPSFKVG